MFFYLAFIASGALGGLIALTQLTSALANSSRAAEAPEILKGLGVDVGAVLIFAFLYSRESNAKNAQLARLSREESLSNLKLRIDEKKVIPVSSLRGIARLVILAGPASFISESFTRSIPFTEALLDRGVLVVPFATDGNIPAIDFEENEEDMSLLQRKKRLWQLTPVYASEWSKWLDEQKEMAKVALDAPVYLSLRMDGRVRGSGVGYPPWNAFVAQLPPVKRNLDGAARWHGWKSPLISYLLFTTADGEGAYRQSWQLRRRNQHKYFFIEKYKSIPRLGTWLTFPGSILPLVNMNTKLTGRMQQFGSEL